MIEHTRRIVVAGLVALACMAAFTPTADLAAQEASMAGEWTGVLAAQGMEIELIFKVVEGEDGTLSTTLDVPAQGAAGIACTDTTVDEEGLHISGCEIPGGGGYDGALNEEGGLSGNFNQAGMPFPLDLKPVTDE